MDMKRCSMKCCAWSSCTIQGLTLTQQRSLTEKCDSLPMMTLTKCCFGALSVYAGQLVGVYATYHRAPAGSRLLACRGNRSKIQSTKYFILMAAYKATIATFGGTEIPLKQCRAPTKQDPFEFNSFHAAIYG